jgi:hypothetical protein
MTEVTTLGLLELSRRIGEHVSGVLVPRGFRFDEQRRLWIRPRCRDIHDGVTILIDIPGSKGSLFVTANLSVFSPGILARLDGQKTLAARLHLASLTRNIGQLLPAGAWRQWEIADDATRDWTLGAFLAVLVDGGLTWQEQFDDLDALRDGFVQFGHQDHVQLTVPVVDQMVADEQTAILNRREDSSSSVPPRRPHARRSRQVAAAVAEPLWVCDD